MSWKQRNVSSSSKKERLVLVKDAPASFTSMGTPVIHVEIRPINTPRGFLEGTDPIGLRVDVKGLEDEFSTPSKIWNYLVLFHGDAHMLVQYAAAGAPELIPVDDEERHCFILDKVEEWQKQRREAR